MKKNRKETTGKKLNLEKLQIAKIENPKIIMGGKKNDDPSYSTSIHWPGF